MSGSRSRRFGLLVAACVPALSGLAGAAGDLTAQVPTSPPAAQAPVPDAAQAVTVHGTVVDDKTGEPVLGATVAREGGPERARSDERGAFTLRLPDANGTLVVSRIGFAQAHVPLGGRTTVTVRLARVAVTLSDVVVVGYGTQKRSDVTGSVASVSPDKLEEKPNTSLAQALEGSVPGVAVSTTGAGAEQRINIQVRGRKSISASTDPFVVVDGIPFEGTVSEINPSDIASIEILKDASAAAIYGSRGSNGVILITTKKGTVGKPRVSYSAYAGTQQISNLPDMMDARQFADFKCMRINGGLNCDTALTATERANLAAGVNTDWLKQATRTGRQQQHDLSLSGGTEDTKYYLGGSLLNVAGVAVNDKFDRVTLRANLDQRVKSWLRVGTNSQVARTDRSGVAPNFTDAFVANPLLTPYDANGNFLVQPWSEDPTLHNPVEARNAIDDDITKRLFTSNYVEVSVPRVSGLSYRLNAGLEISDRDGGRYYGRNTSTGLPVLGQSIISGTRRHDWTVENILRYTRTFGRHGLDFTGLYSAQSKNLDVDTLRASGYPNDLLDYHSTQPTVTSEAFWPKDEGVVSQMGRLNYTFAERYLATLTVRRDESSVFGRNNRVGVFPSLALGWNVQNESFFPWKDKVDVLKLRYSYGKNGNQAIQPFQTLSQFRDFSYLSGDQPAAGVIPATLGNPDLKWETTLSSNFGLDVALFKQRVRATADVYSSRTSDLLLRRTVPPQTGIDQIYANIGKTSNKGFELSLSTVNVTRGSFSWTTDVNLSHNDNRIVDLYGNKTDDIANGWFIGMPIDVNYGYKFDGIWQVGDDIVNSAQPTAKPGDVRIRDVNGDKKIDALDRTFHGSIEPKYSAGLSNTLKLKRFTLSAFFNTVQGVTRSNDLLGTNRVFSDVRRNTLYRQYWTPDNPINNYPANSNTSNPLSVPFYEDASFIRLKDLTLSYDFPQTLLGRVGGESLRLYVTGRNIWTHTDWSGLDPELDDQQSTPLEKVVIGGLTVRF